MVQYIDKSILIMEIKRRLEERKETLKNCDSTIFGIVLKSSMSVYQNLLYFLDTIETKEVDLEKEATHYLLYEHRSPLNEIMHKADLKLEIEYHKDIENAFKAGFELGLKM